MTRAPIDLYLDEDLGALDLTTRVLGLGQEPGRLVFAARAPTIMAGGALAAALLRRAGAAHVAVAAEGARLAPGERLLEATGPAEVLFAGWKVAQNLIDYACGVALRARELVERARAVRPDIAVLATRKTIPGSRAIALAGILAGGAWPHRLGLAETVLVFPQHRAFLGGLDGLVARLPALRRQLLEKKIVVEAESVEDGLALARAGVDIVQFDKLSPEALRAVVPEARALAPSILLLAAGGIDRDNVAAYAASGVDGLVTSWPYFGPPADVAVTLAPVAAAA